MSRHIWKQNDWKWHVWLTKKQILNKMTIGSWLKITTRIYMNHEDIPNHESNMKAKSTRAKYEDKMTCKMFILKQNDCKRQLWTQSDQARKKHEITPTSQTLRQYDHNKPWQNIYYWTKLDANWSLRCKGWLPKVQCGNWKLNKRNRYWHRQKKKEKSNIKKFTTQRKDTASQSHRNTVESQARRQTPGTALI